MTTWSIYSNFILFSGSQTYFLKLSEYFPTKNSIFALKIAHLNSKKSGKMRKSVKKCEKMRKSVKKCEKMRKSVKKHEKVSKNAKNVGNLSRKILQAIPKKVRTWANKVVEIQKYYVLFSFRVTHFISLGTYLF